MNDWSTTELTWWRDLWMVTALTIAAITVVLCGLYATSVFPPVPGQGMALGGLTAITVLSGGSWAYFGSLVVERREAKRGGSR